MIPKRWLHKIQTWDYKTYLLLPNTSTGRQPSQNLLNVEIFVIETLQHRQSTDNVMNPHIPILRSCNFSVIFLSHSHQNFLKVYSLSKINLTLQYHWCLTFGILWQHGVSDSNPFRLLSSGTDHKVSQIKSIC